MKVREVTGSVLKKAFVASQWIVYSSFCFPWVPAVTRSSTWWDCRSMIFREIVSGSALAKTCMYAITFIRQRREDNEIPGCRKGFVAKLEHRITCFICSQDLSQISVTNYQRISQIRQCNLADRDQAFRQPFLSRDRRLEQALTGGVLSA